jgi:hypothetical protein
MAKPVGGQRSLSVPTNREAPIPAVAPVIMLITLINTSWPAIVLAFRSSSGRGPLPSLICRFMRQLSAHREIREMNAQAEVPKKLAPMKDAATAIFGFDPTISFCCGG